MQLYPIIDMKENLLAPKLLIYQAFMRFKDEISHSKRLKFVPASNHASNAKINEEIKVYDGKL